MKTIYEIGLKPIDIGNMNPLGFRLHSKCFTDKLEANKYYEELEEKDHKNYEVYCYIYAMTDSVM